MFSFLEDAFFASRSYARRRVGCDWFKDRIFGDDNAS